MTSRRSTLTLADLGLVVLTLVTIGIVVLALRPPAPPVTTTDSVVSDPVGSDDTTATEPAADPDQPQVVVLGDSFTNGGEEYDGTTWTELVADERGWTVEVSAPGGSGYVTPGGGNPVPDRVARELERYPDADLWVVAAGASDIARDIAIPDVVAAASEVLAEIEAGSPAPIVLTSPFAVAAPSETTLELRDELAEVCATTPRCTYVDATSWYDRDTDDLMDPSGLNPTQKGQRRLSREFLEVLPELDS